ncbi:hypothetical protein LL252_03110 [Alcanivorax marinus]|uniref:Uncharacterized protein n=1 Tax=Alloalcanivorax marinus TaxID=1177169 RepID=A0A9Q3UI01_9GAMM|nr:hypothetical protein [Alloalcanivorax marinus]MCC4307551.1 hypothetical protein [Alloalcanivorax marinus]
MIQFDYLLISTLLASAALVLAVISLWLTHNNRKKQRLPNALSKKIGVIALVLEARCKYSDMAILSGYQVLLIGSLVSGDLSKEHARAKNALAVALEKIERCDEFCMHARVLDFDSFEESPSLALTAEEMLAEATAALVAEKDAFTDLKGSNFLG